MQVESDFKTFLQQKVDLYNRSSFIEGDPVCIPHLFTRQQDIEIAGFFAAIFAWGNRTTIINKSRELMQRMEMQPYEFVLHAGPADLRRLEGFRHRTFNEDDLLYFVDFFRRHYTGNTSLECAFIRGMDDTADSIEQGLINFRNYFFEGEHFARTEKHISSPAYKSSCKRLNMFLRWMVRSDDKGVDFGIWNQLSPRQLVCPLDVHVARVAKRFGLLHRNATDWQAALELTYYLRQLDPSDPVQYDFALFGLGVMEKY